MKPALLLLLLATLSAAIVDVRFAHVAFNTSAVDVMVNTTSLGTINPNDFSPIKQLTTGGLYEIVVRDTATQAVLLNVTATLEEMKSYTIFGSGANEHLEATLSVDDYAAPADSYSTKIRFFQGVTDVTTAEILADGVVIATLNKNQAAYVALPAGTHTFAFKAQGGVSPLFEAPYTIVGGYIYTFAPNGVVGHNITVAMAVDREYQYFNARVAHLSPDAGAVDVFLKDETEVASHIFSSNQAFKTITEYKLMPFIPTRSYSFVVTPHDQGNVTVSVAPVDLTVNTFTINLYGLVTPSIHSFKIGYQADNNGAPANALANKVRFFHAIPGIADLDLWVNDKAIFSAIPFGNGTEFVTLPTGTHTFTLKSGADVVATAALQLVGGGVYTIYAEGLAGGNGTNLPALALNAAATYTYFEMRATHAAPGVGASTFTIKDVHGGVVYTTTLAYGQFSNYVTLVVQKYIMDFSIISQEFNRNAGEVVTVALMGNTVLTAPVFNDANGAPKGSAWARVRFIHAAVNGPAVNVKFGDNTLFKDIAFQHASEYAEISAGTWPVTVYAGDVNVLSLTHNFLGGGVYTVLAEGIVEHNSTSPLSAVVSTDRAYQYFSLRATHAASDAGNVDFLLDDGYTSMTAFGNVAYGSSVGYTEFVLSTYTLKVTEAGKPNNVVKTITPGFAANTYYTVAVVGQVAVNTSTPIEILSTVDNNKAPEASSKAIIRFIHAVAAGAPNVDVYFNNLQTPLFKDVAYKSITEATTEIDAGTYSVIVYQHGTNTLLAHVDDLKIAGGQDITVVAMGTPNNIVVKPETLNHFNYFSLRFVHSSYSVGAVTVLLEGQAVWTDIEPGKITGWSEFLSMNHKNITVVHNGVAIASRNEPFADSKGTTIILVGLNEVNSSTPVQLLAKEETAAVAGSFTAALVRIVHTSPNTPPVELKFNETTQFNGVEYKQITDYKEIAAGNYTLNIFTPSVNHTIYEHPVELWGGYTYTLYVEGMLAGLSVQQSIDYQRPSNGYVRFFHTSTNTNNVDLVVDWIMNSGFRNVAFKGATDYQPYLSGDHDLKVLPTDLKTPVLAEQKMTLSTASWNSVLFLGLSEFENHTSTLETMVIPDVAELPTEGNVLIRFISASPNAPALELRANGLAIFNNVSYKEHTEYHTVPADHYKIELYETGGASVLLGSDFDFRVSSGSAIYTLIAEGIYGQPSFQIMAFRDHGAAPPGEPSGHPAKKGMPAWAVGLIVAAVILAVIAVAAGGFILYRRKRRAGYSEISTHDA